ALQQPAARLPLAAALRGGDRGDPRATDADRGDARSVGRGRRSDPAAAERGLRAGAGSAAVSDLRAAGCGPCARGGGGGRPGAAGYGSEAPRLSPPRGPPRLPGSMDRAPTAPPTRLTPRRHDLPVRARR